MNEIIRVIGELLFIDNVGAFIRFIRYNIFERARKNRKLKIKKKSQNEMTKISYMDLFFCLLLFLQSGYIKKCSIVSP